MKYHNPYIYNYFHIKINFVLKILLFYQLLLYLYHFLWCKKNNYTYKLFGLDDFKDTINFADMKNEVNSQITKFDARDYQLSAIYQALTNKRGVLLSCTGSGKSLMIYGILKYLINRKNKRHLLLIVPSVSLVEQMYSDFIDYGW